MRMWCLASNQVIEGEAGGRESDAKLKTLPIDDHYYEEKDADHEEDDDDGDDDDYDHEDDKDDDDSSSSPSLQLVKELVDQVLLVLLGHCSTM